MILTFDFRDAQKPKHEFIMMPRSLNMNLYLRAFSIAMYQKFDLYYLCLFRLFTGLQIIQFWSVNYASYFRPS